MGKKKVIGTTVNSKKTVNDSPTGSTNAEYPTFRFDWIDRGGPFAFDIRREDFNHKLVIEKLLDYGGMTWGDIVTQTHDRNKSKHHILSEGSISKEGMERIRSLGLDEYSDRIFSFALQNIVRIVGIREGVTFYVVWYDANHKFCLTKK